MFLPLWKVFVGPANTDIIRDESNDDLTNSLSSEVERTFAVADGDSCENNASMVPECYCDWVNGTDKGSLK